MNEGNLTTAQCEYWKTFETTKKEAARSCSFNILSIELCAGASQKRTATKKNASTCLYEICVENKTTETRP